MKNNTFLENKENIITNNYQDIYYSKIVKYPKSYLTIKEIPKKYDGERRNNEKMDKNTINLLNEGEQINEIDKFYNYFNNYNNITTEEDVDIELSSISKKIPINNFINLEQMNITQKTKLSIQAKSKIKRTQSINSFFDDNQRSNKNNCNNYNIYNDKNNSNQSSEFNLTNFDSENRPKINKMNANKKEDKKSNYFNNITNNNINNITNNNINNNISLFNKKNYLSIKRHNSVLMPDINKYLESNNEISSLNSNTNHNNQYLFEEIQKLKKENKRLFLKNNELSFKLKTQDAKTKINNNYNSINHKKITSQKEEFLLQKIKKLENEIIKQKDIIKKIKYNKRFIKDLRKIRVNSILIQGNNKKVKRKNSYNFNNLYCNRMNKKKITTKQTNFNKTVSDEFNKCIRRKSQNLKLGKEGLPMKIKPSHSSTSPKYLNKITKNDLNQKQNKKNTTMISYNKDNSIKLTLDNFELNKNFRKSGKIRERKIYNFIFDKNKNYDINNNLKRLNNNEYISNYNYKKLASHKAYGKTSLIMSVINDNLLGNFDLSRNSVEDNSNNNKEKTK